MGYPMHSVLSFKVMKAKHSIAESGPDRHKAAATPVKELDVPLTPKAQAKEANKLPRAEQMKKFEQSLEAHDPGNQPA
jgi:hypothetical protein